MSFRINVRNTKGDETREYKSDAVTLECPRDSLSRFEAGVKHGHDSHNAGSDATFWRS